MTTFPRKTLLAAQYAAMAVLFCNGLLYAAWGVSVATIKSKFDLSEGMLSLALAAVAIGGVTTMRVTGAWIAKVGSGKASLVSGVLTAIIISPLFLIPSYWLLVGLILMYGAATAANDIAGNAQGAFIEQLSQRSVIGALHGSFSIGGLCGALFASGWAFMQLPIATSFYFLGALVSLTIAIASMYLLNENGDKAVSSSLTNQTNLSAELRAIVHARLKFFGILSFLALIVEGAFYDWSAVYMREVVHAPTAVLGLAYAAFAIGMALGRVSGDRLRDTYPHQAVMIASGIVSTLGLIVILLIGSPLQVISGFFITGLGLANMIPMLFSSAGKLSTNAGMAASYGLAQTTRVAYVGLLVGPFLIGPIAEVVGLRLSLISLILAIAMTCVGWLWLSQRSAGTPWLISTAQNDSR